MKVFVIGATGLIGSHAARCMQANGHELTGLARSTASQERLRSWGIVPVAGDVAEQPILRQAALEADATVFAPALGEEETAVVTWLLEQLAGSNKTFIFTSGTGVLAQRTFGDWSEDTFGEDDTFIPLRSLQGRLALENLVRGAGQRSVRGIVMRPPAVWADGRPHSLVTSVAKSAKKTGAACYVGKGLNLYANVHAQDLGRAFNLVLEKGEPGAVYHAVAGEVPNRWIAEMVARVLGCPTRSITMDEAIELWGKFAALVVMGVCSRSRSPKTRSLGWAPERTDMLAAAEAVLREGQACG